MIGLLGLVWAFNVLSVGLLVVSLVSHSAVHITGKQLLISGFVVWIASVIAFGLAYWELDSGGPVARAMAKTRSKPDFQFPQDDNPDMAREGWAPRLWDYLYVSLTNAMAFSPTDVDAPDTPGEDDHGGRVDALGDHHPSGRSTRREHPLVAVAGRDEPALVRVDHRLHAVAKVELLEDAGDVGLRGRLADHEPLADLRIRKSTGK